LWPMIPRNDGRLRGKRKNGVKQIDIYESSAGTYSFLVVLVLRT
jgi:hypothetical protein